MNAPEFLVIVTPRLRTSTGRRASAVLTRFWTSTAARSMLREASNVTEMTDEPSFEDEDVTYFIPCTPLICCSSGIVTPDSTSAALAPTYDAATMTWGSAICGYCAIGRPGMTTVPAITMMIAQTMAKTTRRMKNRRSPRSCPRRVRVDARAKPGK